MEKFLKVLGRYSKNLGCSSRLTTTNSANFVLEKFFKMKRSFSKFLRENSKFWKKLKVMKKIIERFRMGIKTFEFECEMRGPKALRDTNWPFFGQNINSYTKIYRSTL